MESKDESNEEELYCVIQWGTTTMNVFVHARSQFGSTTTTAA